MNTVVCGLISRPLDFIIGAVYIFHLFPSQSGAVTMYLAAKRHLYIGNLSAYIKLMEKDRLEIVFLFSFQIFIFVFMICFL